MASVQSNANYSSNVAGLLEAIIQNAPDVIAITDKVGKIIFINEKSEPLFGYASNELTGKNIQLLMPTFSIEQQASQPASPPSSPRKKIAQEYPILKALHKSGSEIQVAIHLRTFPPASGYETLYQISIRDAKARRKTEQQFQAQHVAMMAAANGIIITDTDGIIQWINPAVTRITGYSAEEIIGQHTRLMQSGKHSETFYQEIWATVLSGEVWQGDTINRRKDGSLYYEEQSISPVFDDQGEITQLIAIKQDITKRRRAELKAEKASKEIRGQLAEITRLAGLLQNSNKKLDKKVQEKSEELAISHMALAEANRQLLGLNELKSSFIGMITHELRTPLASTLFTVQLIERGFFESMSSEEKELFQQLQNNLSTSKAMIDNLVRYADFIAKQGVLERKDIDINEIAGQILSILHKEMENKSLMLTGTIEPDLPSVRCDEERLADVFNELFKNAVQFTPEGGNIHLKIWADTEKIYISVSDTGIGIAAEDIPRLWKGFSQIADPFKRGNIGLGLGLALVKHIVEAHQGDVWAASELGVGSTFGFSLPLSQ